MPSTRWLAALVVAPVLVLSLLAVPTAGAESPSIARPASADPVADAEQRVIDGINARRHAKHLRPLRLDARVAEVARARSQDMIDRHYFAHRDPDGKYARQHIAKAHISASAVGEMIAWTQGSDLMAAAHLAVRLWLGDAIHRHEVYIKTRNYFGAGIATDGRTIKLTVISIAGPDRTAPVARMTGAASAGGSVSLSWTGRNPRLVVRTSGLRDFDIETRSDGGPWTYVVRHTSRTTRVTTGGDTSEFRVRARDEAGNVGSWSAIVTPGG